MLDSPEQSQSNQRFNSQIKIHQLLSAQLQRCTLTSWTVKQMVQTNTCKLSNIYSCFYNAMLILPVLPSSHLPPEDALGGVVVVATRTTHQHRKHITRCVLFVVQISPTSVLGQSGVILKCILIESVILIPPSLVPSYCLTFFTC